MKLSKCVAMCLLGSASVMMGAESLQEALKNGTISSEAKFMYLRGTGINNADSGAFGGVNDKKNASIGLNLNYDSGSFYGFKFGAGFEGSHDFDIQDEGQDDSRNSISGANLYRLYLQYDIYKSSIKYGRQQIHTPLLLNSSVFPMQDSFTGLSVTTNAIPDTRVQLYYLKDWDKRYGNDAAEGSVVQEDTHYTSPLLSAYIKNKSIDGLTLDGQYLTTGENAMSGDAPVFVQTSKGYSTYYIRGNYDINDMFSVGAIFGGASYEAKGQDDTNFYGANFQTRFSNIATVDLSYTSINEDNDFVGTLGHAPDVMMYTSGLIVSSLFAGTDNYSLGVKLNDFGIPGFSAKLKGLYHTQSDKGIENSIATTGHGVDGVKEIDLDLNYKFSGALKGLSTRIYCGYADGDMDGDNDIYYGRFYLIYKFKS